MIARIHAAADHEIKRVRRELEIQLAVLEFQKRRLKARHRRILYGRGLAGLIRMNIARWRRGDA